MMLKTLIKYLKDMEMLYGDAVVCIKDDNKEYRITSVKGFMGEKRKNECRDPNIVIINARQTE